MTKFRAVRNFLRAPGVNVVQGDVLELADAEAVNLMCMDAVEPVEARDRQRALKARVAWERPVEPKPETRGFFALADQRDEFKRVA